MATSRWTVAASSFVLGAACMATLGAGAATLTWTYWQRTPRPADREAPSVYPRDQFAGLVMGKEEEEVLENVGKPDTTSKDAEAKYWHYLKRTKDPVTGAVDTDAQVVLRRGKVVAINY